MKNSKSSIRIFIVAILWFVSILAVYFIAVNKNHTQNSHYESSIEADTIIKKSWELEHFQLYFKHVVEGDSYSVSAFLTIHLNNNDQNYYLFDCNPYMDEDAIAPQRLFDNIYCFPYVTGGNYSRSSGIELFRVTSDTVVYIGKVCGYDDIYKNGENEFWIYIVSEYGEGNAFNNLEKVPVKLSGDSLIYPFLDGGY